MKKYIVLDVWGATANKLLKENGVSSIEVRANSAEEAATNVAGVQMFCQPMDNERAKHALPIADQNEPGLLVIEIE